MRITALLLTVLFAAAAPAAARALDLSPLYLSPGVSAPGVNKAGCVASPDHPEPVILVHGWTGDRTVTWPVIGPALARAGWCAYALDLPRRGFVTVEESGGALDRFIAAVRHRTGASRVKVVGYSLGGVVSRWLAHTRGAGIDEIVALGSPNHGTDSPAMILGHIGAVGCSVCRELSYGASWIRAFNAAGETRPGIDYTVIATRLDDVATPYQTAFLSGPAKHVTNLTLQGACPLDVSDHFALVTDRVAVAWTLDALDRRGPASSTFRPRC
jgi:triacylglycerol lipase